MGRSRGGFGSKLHVAVDARGVPVVLKLTAGQESDATHAGSLLGNHRPKAVIADKGTTATAFVLTLLHWERRRSFLHSNAARHL